jgi:ubiquinone biosynthesis protein
MALLDRLGTAGAMRFPEELTLFRKAVLTLSGVIADVSGQPSIDAVLIATGLTQYCREWPARGWTPFDSRAFGSHLSNADGFGLWAGLPATVARYGIGLWQDALDAGKTPGGGRAVR